MEHVQQAIEAAVKERAARADQLAQWRQALITSGRTPSTLAGCTALAREELRLLKGVKAVNTHGLDGQALTAARQSRQEAITDYQQGQGTDYTSRQLTDLLKVTDSMARAIKADVQRLEALEDKDAYTRLYTTTKALCAAVLTLMPPPGLPSFLDGAVMRLYISVREPVRKVLTALQPYDHRGEEVTPAPPSRKGGQRPGSGRKAVEGKRYTFTLTPEEYEQVKGFIKALRNPSI